MLIYAKSNNQNRRQEQAWSYGTKTLINKPYALLNCSF
ncbi:unnamed protein product [Ixodes pacificus]